jgi:hypothetical protein
MSDNPLINQLPSEVIRWKEKIVLIEKEDSIGSLSLRDGEREVFLELKEFWMYNDFNPNHAKDLINELKKHEPYHSPKWEDLGDFRRICLNYYTKDRAVFESFQRQLGGKQNSAANNSSNNTTQKNDDEDVAFFEENMSGEAYYGGNLTTEEISQVIYDNNNLNLRYYYGEEWQNEYEWVRKCWNEKILDIFTFHFLVTQDSFWSGKSGFALGYWREEPSYVLVFFDNSKDALSLIISLNNKNISNDYVEYLTSPFRIRSYDRSEKKYNINKFKLSSDIETLLCKILDKWESNSLI